MGFFSKKKKSTPSSSPAFSYSPTMPSAPVVPQIVEPVEPPMTLSVVLDGWEREGDEQCFTINISQEADTTILRQVLASKLGDVSMSLFKVSNPTIPRDELINRLLFQNPLPSRQEDIRSFINFLLISSPSSPLSTLMMSINSFPV
jgi:hypothetical protein